MNTAVPLINLGLTYTFNEDLHLLSWEEHDAVERSGKSSFMEYATTPTVWPKAKKSRVIPLMERRPGKTKVGYSPVQFVPDTSDSDRFRPAKAPRVHMIGGCPYSKNEGTSEGRTIARWQFSKYYKKDGALLCMNCVAKYILTK